MNTIKKITNVISIPIMLIVLLIIIILVIYIGWRLYNYYTKKNLGEPKLLCKIRNAEESMNFDSKIIKLPEFNNGIEATFSCWIYIKDWNRIDNNKKRYILKWSDKTKTANKTRFGGLEVYLDSLNNSLIVTFSSNYKTKEYYDSIKLNNIALQKWLNITIIIKNRYLDLFINGKLYKSKFLSVVPIILSRKLEICPENGFKGFINKIHYYNRAIKQNEITSLFDSSPKCNIIQKFKAYKYESKSSNSCST